MNYDAVRLWGSYEYLEEDFEAAISGCLVNTKLGPHERTPSWEGEDVFSVCDILPFPKSLINALTAGWEWVFRPTASATASGNSTQTRSSYSSNCEHRGL